MSKCSDFNMNDNVRDNISQPDGWSCPPPLHVDYKLSHYDGDGKGYDDDHDHLMVGVGPLLDKQIVNGLVAEAR